MVFRHKHCDDFCGSKSFQLGSSTTNTVEITFLHIYCKVTVSCYRRLRVGGHAQVRKSVTDWWINVVKVIHVITAKGIIMSLVIICTGSGPRRIL